MSLFWQFTIVSICVLWAAWEIVRRVKATFFEKSASGCGAGGCDQCPANAELSKTLTTHGARVANDGFVPLQTLVDSGNKVTDSTRN